MTSSVNSFKNRYKKHTQSGHGVTHLNCEWSLRRNTGVDYTWTTTLPERPYLGHWESTYKHARLIEELFSTWIRVFCGPERGPKYLQLLARHKLPDGIPLVTSANEPRRKRLLQNIKCEQSSKF
jgi:hypothetical protein